MKINRNMSAVVANRQLLRTENKLSLSMGRLSSGYKINKAGDNPAGMAISSKMKAQIDGLNQAEANSDDGQSVLRIADGALNEESAEEARKVAIVKSAISTLSFSELEAITHIFDELDGNEGILVASRIADRVGITRSVIVNALRKFESAGVIESRSSGMKGTYIKVVNDVVFDELAELKRKNAK